MSQLVHRRMLRHGGHRSRQLPEEEDAVERRQPEEGMTHPEGQPSRRPVDHLDQAVGEQRCCPHDQEHVGQHVQGYQVSRAISERRDHAGQGHAQSGPQRPAMASHRSYFGG